MGRLNWPTETAGKHQAYPWFHAGSNVVMDFHGDPCKAELVVFSDGNHHMALLESLAAYGEQAGVGIFYATLPPNNLINAVKMGGIGLGNLILSAQPHVFISPAKTLDQLASLGKVAHHKPFMKSQGNVLLVRHGNPKNIQTVADLLRKDVRLFSPNPAKETAAYQVYFDSIMAIAGASGLNKGDFEQLYGSPDRMHYGECIHHREAPQALMDHQADVAFLYYHLALRYTRIFPAQFDYVYLGEKPAKTLYHPANVISVYHAGLVGDGGPHGAALLEFLAGNKVTKIYEQHGLYRPEKFA